MHYALGLQQMTTAMCCKNQESGCNREAQERDEWILEADAIEIEVRGFMQQLQRFGMSAAKIVKSNLRID